MNIFLENFLEVLPFSCWSLFIFFCYICTDTHNNNWNMKFMLNSLWLDMIKKNSILSCSMLIVSYTLLEKQNKTYFKLNSLLSIFFLISWKQEKCVSNWCKWLNCFSAHSNFFPFINIIIANKNLPDGGGAV